jgi:hypothetical protein
MKPHRCREAPTGTVAISPPAPARTSGLLRCARNDRAVAWSLAPCFFLGGGLSEAVIGAGTAAQFLADFGAEPLGAAGRAGPARAELGTAVRLQ